MCPSIVVKGAPEMIETLLAEVPSTYRSTYRLLMFAGARVLALAWRPVPSDVTSTQARAWARQEVECDLQFAGFLVRRRVPRPWVSRCSMVVAARRLTSAAVVSSLRTGT